MDPERWQRVETLFDRALEIPAPGRSAYLARETADDPSLHEDVQRLLDADRAANDSKGELIASVIFDSTDLLEELEEANIQKGNFPGYELLEKIGEGGFGVVYRGFDPSLNREVAIKICTSANPRIRERFYREAQISAQLQHPNITTIFALGPADQVPPFFVQELLSGEDLSETIERRDPLDLPARLQILLQVAHGLDHAHRAGVLHRDVKPGNIRVLDDGQIKILDFGIARLEEEQSPITTEGMAIGTVGYLSPEQLEGTDLDRRTDIFSFGVLAYELLLHRRPFPGTKFSEVAYKLMFEAPRPLSEIWPDCPIALEKVVLRCLEKQRNNRYSDFSAVIADLESVASMVAPDSQTSFFTRATWKAHQRRVLGLVTVGVATVALVTWLAVTTPGSRPRPPVDGVSRPGSGVPAPPSPLPIELPSQEAQPEETRAPRHGGLGSESDSALPSPPAASAGAEVVLENAPGATDSSDLPPPSPHRRDGSAGIDPGVRGPAADPASAENTGETPLDPTKSRAENTYAQSTSVPPALARIPSPARGDTEDLGSPPGALQPSSSKEPAAGDPAAGEPIVEEPGDRQALDRAEPTESVEPIEISRPEPAYPRWALHRKQEATVVVLVLVGTGGEVLATTLKTPGPKGFGFDEAALEAAKGSRFQAGTREGAPAEMWTEMVFRFRLKP